MVHSDQLEKCVCETYITGRKCPYHAVLKVAPEERSAAMKAVVESHDLVIETGQLLLTTRAHTQLEDVDRLHLIRGAVEASEEGAVLEKVYNYSHTDTHSLSCCAFIQQYSSQGGCRGPLPAVGCFLLLTRDTLHEQGAVKLIKAALLHRGVNVHIPLAPMEEFGARLTFCGLAEGTLLTSL